MKKLILIVVSILMAINSSFICVFADEENNSGLNSTVQEDEDNKEYSNQIENDNENDLFNQNTILLSSSGENSCGDNVSYSISGTTLTISGTGDMDGYTYSAPWQTKNISKVIIEDGVTSIGARAFANMRITSIYIPDSVTAIYDNAFQNTTTLKDIYIPSTVTFVSNYGYSFSAFLGCSEKMVIYTGRSSGYGGYWNSYYGSTTFLKTIYNFSRDDYYYWSKFDKSGENIVISSETTKIPESFFFGCENIKTVTLPDGLAEIGDSAFYGCINMTDINIPSSVQSIGQKAFQKCWALNNVVLPEGLKYINDYTFAACNSFTQIKIPSSVVRIGANAFGGYSGNSIFIPSTVTTISANWSSGIVPFYGCSPYKLVIYTDANEKNPGWSDDWNRVTTTQYLTVEYNTPYSKYEVINRLKDIKIDYVNVDGILNPNVSSFYFGDEDITLLDVAKPGYDFVGWYLEDDFRIKIDIIDTDDEKYINGLTLFAKWEQKELDYYVENSDSDNLTIVPLGKQAVSLINSIPSQSIDGIGDLLLIEIFGPAFGNAIVTSSCISNNKIIIPTNMFKDNNLNELTLDGLYDLKLTKTGYPTITIKDVHICTNINELSTAKEGERLDLETSIEYGNTIAEINESLKIYNYTNNIRNNITDNSNLRLQIYDITNNSLDGLHDNEYLLNNDDILIEGRIYSISVFARNVYNDLQNPINNNEYEIYLNGVKSMLAQDKPGYGSTSIFATMINMELSSFYKRDFTYLNGKLYEGYYYDLSSVKYENVDDAINTNPLLIDENNTISLTLPIKDGYTFNGWYKEPNFKTKVTSLKYLKGTIQTIYAKWTPIKYTIKYNLNGGKNASNIYSSYYVYSEDFSLPIPTKTGYLFKGWYLDSKLSNLAIPFEEDNITQIVNQGSNVNYNLYAKWEPIHYLIHFSQNNIQAFGEMEDIEVEYGQYIVIPPLGFSVNIQEVKFSKWEDVSTGKTYNNKAKVSNLTTIDGDIVTLKAIWSYPKSSVFSIKYNLNGGTKVNNPSSYNVGTPEFVLLEPTKTGYKFVGWFDSYTKASKNNPEEIWGNEVVTISGDNKSNYTLYAKWEPITYRVTIIDGFDDRSEDRIVAYNETSYLDPNNYIVRNGYTLSGWIAYPMSGKAQSLKPKSSFKNLTTIDGDARIIEAKWTPNTYKIKYVLDKGVTNGSKNPTSFKYSDNEEDILYLNSPTKKGIEFLGWYLDNASIEDNKLNYDEELDKYYISNKHIGDYTLVSKFSTEYEVYSITYLGDLASFTEANPNPIDYTYNSAKITLLNPTKDGYTFLGWYNLDSNKKVTTIANHSMGSMRLEARWQENSYKLAYNVNGGKVDKTTPLPKTTTYKYTDTVTLTDVEPTKLGYTFIGWSKDKKATIATYNSDNTNLTGINGDLKNGSTVTLYAVWQPINYTVKFDINTNNPYARENEMANMENLSYDTSYKLNQCLYSRTDGSATFAGWSLTPDGKVKYKDNASIKNLCSEDDSTITLYAQYKYTKTYTITYVLDGGTNSKENIKTYNADTDFTFKAPTKKGYFFKGWYDSSLNEITKINQNTSGNKTLYATWYSTSKDMADYVIENGEVYENQKYINYYEIEDERYNYWFIVYDDNPNMLQFCMEFKDTNKFMSMSFDLNTNTMKTSNFGFFYGTSPNNYIEVGYATLNASTFTKKTKLSFTIWNYSTGKNESGTTKTLYSNYGNEMLQHMVSMFDDILGNFYNIVCGEEVFNSMYDMGFYNYK